MRVNIFCWDVHAPLLRVSDDDFTYQNQNPEAVRLPTTDSALVQKE